MSRLGSGWHLRRAVARDERSRPGGRRAHGYFCNAGATNMYFSATGRVAPCWADVSASPESWSRDRSIMDIWRGPFFERQRGALAARRFVGPCTTCRDQVLDGVTPLARVYDRVEPEGPGPSTFELELSNLCNFECVMCHGLLSSKIRRNRDKLPPIEPPYDERFVDQLAELLPGTRDLRFSGGEPMMHPVVHRIADRIAEHRPDLTICVSTNGSLANERVWQMLERSSVGLFLSFDSLEAERYESIRVGSDFDVLMANIDAFIDHFRTIPGRSSSPPTRCGPTGTRCRTSCAGRTSATWCSASTP
ncbi:MAG: radical SAM protein [Iamia sp.]